MITPLQEMFRTLPEDPAKDGPLFGLYLLSNEGHSYDTLCQMSQLPMTGSVGMGVSGFFTLDVAAVRPETEENRLEGVALVDCSIRVRHFMRKMIEHLKISPSKLDMQEFVRRDILSNATFYYSGGLEPADKIAKEYVQFFNYSLQDCGLQRIPNNPYLSTSWLSDNIRFEKMQRLAIQGNISFSCIDFNRRVYLTDFLRRLQTRSPLDFAYLSNIYMHSFSNFEYVANQLEAVVGSDTYFIDTERFYHFGLQSSNNQRLKQRGQSPLFSIMKKSEKEMELFNKDRDGTASFIP
ncbi:MAG: hypothetical protein FJZ60_02620 [Chlamydiae bacterium]|nr:hypothetical protein [Chlamydiota bacterium]